MTAIIHIYATTNSKSGPGSLAAHQPT